jgi:hypothetical protein
VRLLAVLLIGTAGAGAQVKPLRLAREHARQAITLDKVEFQTAYFGREGPGYTRSKGGPAAGRQQVARATVYGQESVRTIWFELLGEDGRTLGRAAAMRMGRGVDDGEYQLWAPVPAIRFRIRAAGSDTSGAAFSTVYSKVFQPSANAEEPIVPPALPPEHAAAARKTIASFEQDVASRFEQEMEAHPDAMLTMPRIEVAEATYEPYLSASGNPLGIRLRYRMRFSQAGAYVATPHVAPQYGPYEWRGAVTMQVLGGTVEPAPLVSGAGSAEEALRYGAAAEYRAGVDYRFTVDLIPGYLLRNRTGTRYCLNLAELGQGPRREAWNAIQRSAERVKYRVDWSEAGFFAETSPEWPQRIFYESFLKEGAADCGGTPNVNF